MPVYTPLKVGQRVPDFQLETYEPAQGGAGTFSLAVQLAKKRWTILFFYPEDFTFVWATEFAALAEQHDRFVKTGCDVVTVSTDATSVHQAWRAQEKALSTVTFPMGADPAGELSRTFGVLDEASGRALRGTFIVNPEGLLLGSEVNFYNLGRNIDELVRKLKANVYLARKPGEVCPSKWKEEGG